MRGALGQICQARIAAVMVSTVATQSAVGNVALSILKML